MHVFAERSLRQSAMTDGAPLYRGALRPKERIDETYFDRRRSGVE
jgi:hypothetical protein